MDGLKRRIGGIVLCGGESRRMGRPKAWLRVGDEHAVQRVVRVLLSVVNPVVVVAARDQALPALPDGVRVVRDRVTARGPLEGLSAGLHALSGSVDVAFVTACDSPMLQSAFVERMTSLVEGYDAAVCVHEDFPQPLSAAYRTSLAELVEALLEAGHLRLLDLVEASNTRRVPSAQVRDVDPELDSLRNVNTPEEYHAILRALGLGENADGYRTPSRRR